METLHLDKTALEAGLPYIQQSPQNNGLVQQIVIRPKMGERSLMTEGELNVEFGLVGDRWYATCKYRLDDGRPDPETQISLMNVRLLHLIARTKERWPLAGDNLLVDFDLSTNNLQPGHRLAIGSTVLEITQKPHTGCAKFVQRFGKDAATFVNAKATRSLQLRGIYAKVIQSGTVKVGDVIKKL